MVRVFKYILLIGIVLATITAFSQNENSKWYFGLNAGLDFMTNPPTVLTNGALNTGEGCASIADAAGNLLFYTNGVTVYDQTHSTMSNGTFLMGSSLANQSAIILKQPGSGTIYYIFTVGQGGIGNHLYYSTVDMSLSSGNGSVTVKNTLLYSGDCTEQLSWIKNCNGTDYWVMIHAYGNTNDFLAYQLTSAGVNTTAVVSSIGALGSTMGFTSMKFSPNGRKLATGTYSAGAMSVLFDFDSSTGIVSNSLSLPGSTAGFGIEFSPDGTKIYACYGNLLCQWDLCAGSNSAIAASLYTVSTNGTGGGAMQVAKNGKIYVAQDGYQALGVINNPNLQGSSCNYNASGQSISPKFCYFGLPNFTADPIKSVPPFTYTVSNNYGCQGVLFNSPFTVQSYTTTCAGTSFSLTGMSWNFGDAASGSSNTSFLSAPIHTFTGLGNYTVQLVLYYSCGGGTDTLKQVVNVNQSCVTVTSSTITCASLGSATVNPGSGLGPYTYTWMPGAQSGSVATGLIPGTYTITFHDATSNFTGTSSVTFVPVVPLTGNLSYASSVACHGASTASATVNNLAGGSGNQFYLWTNGTTNYTTSFVTLSAGLWSVTVTDALTQCQINDLFLIYQPSACTLNLSSNTPTACTGTNIILTGTNSGGSPGYNYTWTAGPASSTNTVSQSAGGTYVYTLNSTDANNCLVSNTISVDFVSNPVLSVANVSICPLEVGTLSVSGATSYTWNGTLTGNTFTASPLVSQQYTVVGSALSCTSLATPSIILKSLPNPLSANNSPRCNGDNLLLNGGGGVSYFWTGPVSFTSSLQNPNINPVSVNNAGVYNLTVTAANSCTASISRTIVVNPQPTLSASGSTVCTSGTLNLSANSFTGCTYLWSGPPSFTSNLQNPSVVNPPINGTGAYTINVTSAVGCTNSAVVQASVTTPPSLTVSLSGSGTLCAQAFNGSPNTITLTSSGANTYTLTTPNYLYNVNPNGPSSPLISQPPYQNSVAIAMATLVGSNDVCTAVTTVSFSIIPNPTLSISSPTPVICTGKSYTYTNQGATSYSWGPGTPGLSTYTGPVTVASPTVTSVYSVVGGSLGCNSGTQTSTITVYPLPTISIVPATPTICLNSKINLVAAGAVGYTWFPNTGLNTPNDATVSSSPPSEQNYTVIGTSINNCTNTAQVTVSVLPLPVPLASVSKSAACVNETLTFSGSGGIEYAWTGPSNFYMEGQQINLTVSSVYSDGIYTLTVIDKNGCKAISTLPITVYALPEGSLLSSKMQHCVPFCSDFNYVGITNNSPVTTKWSLDNKLFAENSFSYCFTQAGDYAISVQLLDTSTNCTNLKTFVVNAYPVPVANFTIVPAKPVESLDEVFFNNTSEGTDQTKWSWFFIDNHGYQSQNENTSYRFMEAGVYPVAMIVSNKWGCSDSIVKAIEIQTDLAVYVPNVFSPNGDELNDIFLPITRGVKFYDLSIYNRWGAKIFGTTDQLTGWDGSYQGEPCKNDVYTWKIKLSANNGEMKTMTGFVVLSR